MDSAAIEEEAARWLARQQSGEWTPADQQHFDAWIEAAAAHRIQYLRVSAAWQRLSRLHALGAGVPRGTIPLRGSWGDARFFRGALEEESPELAGRQEEASSANIPRERGTSSKYRGRRLAWSVAASTALVLLASALYFLAGAHLVGDEYSTRVGGMDTIALIDGSRVTLNTDTRIRVAFNDAERRIQLTKGEAFFDVAKDEARPFVVYAGDKRVVAIGTKFAVRRDRDDVQVVVTEGRVNLVATDVPVSLLPGTLTTARVRPAQDSSAPSTTFLSAGAIARTSKAQVLVRPEASSEADKLLSWRAGYLVFENTALGDAVAEFNRYNTRKIVIEDEQIAAIVIGGRFRASNADAFLDLLQTGFPIDVERRTDRVLLSAR